MKPSPSLAAAKFIAADDRNYSERAATMTADEREEVKRTTAKFFQELRDIVAREKGLAEQIELIPVAGVNVVREIGRQIEIYTQRNKLQLAQFNSLAVALPDTTFNFGKECLATFRKFPDVVTSAEEAAAAWKRIKVQLELLPNSGHGKQRSHPEEIIMDFLGVVIRATAEAVDVQKKMPMEDWPDFQRNTFEKESLAMHDLHDKAKAIRLGKEKGE